MRRATLATVVVAVLVVATGAIARAEAANYPALAPLLAKAAGAQAP